MLLIVLLPAILAAANACKDAHIMTQLKGTSQLCRMIYTYDHETQQCRFMHCLNPCTQELTPYSTDEKQCQNTCSRIICSQRLLDGSENQNEGNEGGQGGEGGNKLKTILTIVLSIAGAAILLIFGCCIYKRCSNREVNNRNLEPNDTFVVSDEKNIEMLGLQDTEIMKDCSSKNPTDNRNNCAIDLLNKANIKLSCEHFFHPKCIIDWKIKKNCCPLCRTQIKNEFTVYCCVCFVSNLKIKNLLKKKYVCQGCINRPIAESDAVSEAQ